MTGNLTAMLKTPYLQKRFATCSRAGGVRSFAESKLAGGRYQSQGQGRGRGRGFDDPEDIQFCRILRGHTLGVTALVIDSSSGQVDNCIVTGHMTGLIYALLCHQAQSKTSCALCVTTNRH